MQGSGIQQGFRIQCTGSVFRTGDFKQAFPGCMLHQKCFSALATSLRRSHAFQIPISTWQGGSGSQGMQLIPGLEVRRPRT